MMGYSAGTSGASPPHPLLYINDLAVQVHGGGHSGHWWWDSEGGDIVPYP